MTSFGTRKDGRHYPKQSRSSGPSKELLAKMQEDDRFRKTIVSLDKTIEARMNTAFSHIRNTYTPKEQKQIREHAIKLLKEEEKKPLSKRNAEDFRVIALDNAILGAVQRIEHERKSGMHTVDHTGIGNYS